VQQLLEGDGINHYVINSLTPLNARINILNHFRSSEGVNVLLMMLGVDVIG
jgi:hypothetical protein